MRKLLRAGALALAMAIAVPFIPAAHAADQAATIDIGRIKRTLHLTAEQQPYWPPVEAALRRLAREQAKAEPEGLVRRVSHRVVSVVLTGAAIQRVAAAARPLLGVLRDDQKMAAQQLADDMGLGSVVAALN